MRHRKLIITSTLIAFALVVILASVWLLRITETEVTVDSEGSDGKATYDYAIDVLNEYALNKSFIFFSTASLMDKLDDNPYAEVLTVKKVFPNVISVKIRERKASFAVFSESDYYYLDDNLTALKKDSELSENVTVIQAERFGAEIGGRADLSGDVLLANAFGIITAIPDRINTVSEVKLDYEKDRVYVLTKTGAMIEFRFAGDRSESVRKDICGAALSAYEFYLACDEREKSRGFILVYKSDGGELIKEYTETEP